ncbi:MAG: MAPEG family protein [Rhodanobacteraceae bacterium]
MPVAYWCILAAALLPLVFTGIAKGLGRRRFDNAAPRDFQARLAGAPARAHWAHLNSIEAFAPFAAGVLVAEQLHVAQGRIDALALAFVALRLAYGACYIANQATLRSMVWALAFFCVVGLFASAACV